MSTLPTVTLPRNVRRVRIADRAALLCEPKSSHGTVLCLPGFTGSKEDFMTLMPAVSRLGFTSVAIDLIGQYESPWAPEYSLTGWADDAVRIAAELPGPVHLLGHSFGGLIAATADHRGDWASVTLMNSGEGPIHASQHDNLVLLLKVIDELPMADIWAAKDAIERAKGWQPPTAEVAEFMRERFVRTDPRSLAAMSRTLLQGHQHEEEVRARRLLIWGADDPDSWTWSTQEHLAHRWMARLARIPLAGHSPNVDQPDATAAVLTAFIADKQKPCVERRGSGYLEGMKIVTPLESETAAIGRARRVLTDQLWAWGMDDLIDDAELVTSELVTNAIRYGGENIELRITCVDDGIRITVFDAGSNKSPKLAKQDTESPGGRGLQLIAKLARDWGFTETASGTEVWAELSR